MQTIKKMIKTEINIQKSRFITILSPIFHEEEFKRLLERVKTEYPDASHYCYAYLCYPKKRCSDDGEPSGTAGVPILNVLEKQQLEFICCIVVRYFGGTKLGTGGLVRAYTESVKLALKQSEIATMIPAFCVRSSFSYDNQKRIKYLLQSAIIEEEKYQETVEYQYLIPKNDWENVKDEIERLSQTNILTETWILKST